MGQFWSCGQLTSPLGNLFVVIAQQPPGGLVTAPLEFALFCRDFETFFGYQKFAVTSQVDLSLSLLEKGLICHCHLQGA